MQAKAPGRLVSCREKSANGKRMRGAESISHTKWESHETEGGRFRSTVGRRLYWRLMVWRKTHLSFRRGALGRLVYTMQCNRTLSSHNNSHNIYNTTRRRTGNGHDDTKRYLYILITHYTQRGREMPPCSQGDAAQCACNTCRVICAPLPCGQRRTKRR